MGYFLGRKSEHIMVFDDAINVDICESLMFLVDKRDGGKILSTGKTFGGQINQAKNTLDIFLTKEKIESFGCEPNEYLKIKDEIEKSVNLCLDKYIFEFDEISECPHLYNSGFQVGVYRKNVGYYQEHFDSAQWAPKPIDKRILAVVVYLNTVEVGGEIIFTKQNLNYSPKSGSIVIFPASWTHPHIAKTPISSDKWIVTTFISGKQQDSPYND